MAAALASSLSALSLGGAPASHVGLRANRARQTVKLAEGRSDSTSTQPHRLTIRCARVGGVEIPNNRRIEIALTYIHGVGITTARQVLLDLEMENKIARELSEEELTALREEVSKYMIEGDLRRFNNMNIKRLKDIMCYRGRRHINNLPCRGQKTKCNARTRRGKRVAIAGKKKA